MRYLFLFFLLLSLLACEQRKPVDLESLAGQARGGDSAAFRELVNLLSNKGNNVNGRAYKILLDLGQESIPYLQEKVFDSDRERREYVIAGLGSLKALTAVSQISEVLSDQQLGRRYIAAWALGQIGAAEGIKPLLLALGDPDQEVRKYATRALIKLQQKALVPLLGYLESAPPEGVAAAIRALGDIGDRRALPVLLRLADGVHRQEVYFALGKLKAPEAEQVLLTGLRDSHWRNRMHAAMALGPIGSEATIAPLKATLEDEVRVVREWSARSLEMITGERTRYRNQNGELVLPYRVYH